MADDDIKPDAEESAEELEAVATETATEGDQGADEAATKQPEEVAAEQPADEVQAPAEADAVADDTAEAADAEATDPNLSDSNDDGADEPDAENGASGDGNDAVATESLDAAGDTDGDLDAESDDVTESAESAESNDAGDSAESDGSVGSEEEADEEAVDEDLPPPGPPKPEEPKDDCPKCPDGGAPAWMATFADMATLLMAFFVLLLSFAETEVPKFKQVAGSLKQAFGIEKIVPKVTIPMARSIVVENFPPAVAERSVMDIKEQRSDFVRGDFIEKKTEEGEYEDPIESDFQQVQEALEQELNKGMADVRIENGEIKVTLVESASAGGKAGNEGEGKGGQVAQETLDAVAVVNFVGWEDREILKQGLGLAVAKTPEEKTRFNACFDAFFAAVADNDDQDHDDDRPDGPVETDDKLAKMLLDADQSELMVAMEEAATAVGIENIKFFTQRGLYTQRIMRQMGLESLDAAIREAQAGEGSGQGQGQAGVTSHLDRHKQKFARGQLHEAHAFGGLLQQAHQGANQNQAASRCNHHRGQRAQQPPAQLFEVIGKAHLHLAGEIRIPLGCGFDGAHGCRVGSKPKARSGSPHRTRPLPWRTRPGPIPGMRCSCSVGTITTGTFLLPLLRLKWAARSAAVCRSASLISPSEPFNTTWLPGCSWA